MNGKLVRDKIPSIMEANGQQADIRILGEAEYMRALQEKLKEEVREYLEDRTLEELADILEVVYALAAAEGYTKEDLHQACQQKREKRGGFAERIYLAGTREKA